MCINTCTYAFCTLRAPDEAQKAETAVVHYQLANIWGDASRLTLVVYDEVRAVEDYPLLIPENSN